MEKRYFNQSACHIKPDNKSNSVCSNRSCLCGSGFIPLVEKQENRIASILCFDDHCLRPNSTSCLQFPHFGTRPALESIHPSKPASFPASELLRLGICTFLVIGYLRNDVCISR